MRTLRLRLKPLRDLVKIDGSWSVLGADPQFLLKWRFSYTLPSGTYTFVIKESSDFESLSNACFYFDTGAGFNEQERAQAHFYRTSQGIAARLNVDAPVKAIRFDPTEGPDPASFRLDGFQLYISCNASSRKRPPPQVLINLARLLPENAQAGGARRVCLAYIRELMYRFDLRVAVTSHHLYLADEYTDATFVTVNSDNSTEMQPHLQWCSVYIDPLNALRPNEIPSDIFVIVLLHDLQHLRLPHFFSQSELRAREVEYGAAVSRADLLIAISQYERNNIEYFYGTRNTCLIYNAPFMAENASLTHETRRNARDTAQRAYLIYPAVPWLHKNHEVLLQAIAILRIRGIDVHLILTNIDEFNGRGRDIVTLVQILNLSDRVEYKPYVPESELLQLTLGAVGMVFPSLYEGFGIPLVDAMRLGVPVLAACRAAIPEVCGDAVRYMTRPQNAIAVSDDISSFWALPDGVMRQADAGIARSKQFSSGRLGEALAASIIESQSRKKQAKQPRILTASPVHFFDESSVCIIYRHIDASNLEILKTFADVNHYHRILFGSDVHVTICMSIELAADDEIYRIFATAEKLICFNDAHPEGLPKAIYEFSSRHDDCLFQLVTEFPQCVGRYSPKVVRELRSAMQLYPAAGFATISSKVANFVLQPLPDVVAGALEFERRRRDGPILLDALIRRDSSNECHHGTFDFLSRLCTQTRHLHVPSTTI